MAHFEEGSKPIGWYRQLDLEFADGTRSSLIIERKPTGTHLPLPVRPAAWTRLGYHKCPCCPIAGENGTCPAALSMQMTLETLRHRTSTEQVTATAIDDTGNRQTVSWPLQMIGSILVQLAVFSSDCPVGRRVKPHLKKLPPFAPSSELLKHLLVGILGTRGGEIKGAQREVRELIEPLRQVFVYLMLRLRGDEQAHEDAIPNSIVHVDALAQLLSYQADQLTEQMAARLGAAPKPGFWRRLFGASR